MSNTFTVETFHLNKIEFIINRYVTHFKEAREIFAQPTVSVDDLNAHLSILKTYYTKNNEIPQLFNHSLLAGEYYSKLTGSKILEFSEKIEAIKRDVDFIVQFISDKKESGATLTTDEKSYSGAAYSVLNELQGYEDYFLHYRILNEKIKHKFFHSDKDDTIDVLIDEHIRVHINDINTMVVRNNIDARSKFLKETNDYYNFFLINLKLVNYDISISAYNCNQKTKNDLLNIVQLLENYDTVHRTLIQSYLLEKACFLLTKILRRTLKGATSYRFLKYIEKPKAHEYLYLKDYIKVFFKEVESASYCHYGNSRLLEFDNTVSVRNNKSALDFCIEFFEEYGKPVINKRFKNIFKNEAHKEILVSDIHFVCKCIRINKDLILHGHDTKIDYAKVEATLKYLKEYLLHKIVPTSENLEVKIDSISYTKAHQFVICTQFILLKTNTLDSITKFEECFNNHEKVNIFYKSSKEDNTLGIGYREYTPFRIHHFYCEYYYELFTKIEKFISNDNVKIEQTHIDKISELIEDYNLVNQSYREALNNCKLEDDFPMCLPMKECTFAVSTSSDDYKDWVELMKYLAAGEKLIEGETKVTKPSDKDFAILKLKVFLDSSYIPPANYNELKSNYKQQRDETENKIMLILNKLVLLPLNTYKEEIDSKFENKVKESQYNTISGLALYIGIITFVLGSVTVVPKFKHGSSLEVIIAFMLAFAGCLTLFTLIISYLGGYRTDKIKFVWKSFKKDWFNKLMTGILRERRLIAVSTLALIFIITAFWHLDNKTRDINASDEDDMPNSELKTEISHANSGLAKEADKKIMLHNDSVSQDSAKKVKAIIDYIIENSKDK